MARPAGSERERESSLLTTYWSESTYHRDDYSRSALRHGGLNSRFPSSLISTFLGVPRAAAGAHCLTRDTEFHTLSDCVLDALSATKWLPKWLGCEPRLIVMSLDSLSTRRFRELLQHRTGKTLPSVYWARHSLNCVDTLNCVSLNRHSLNCAPTRRFRELLQHRTGKRALLLDRHSPLCVLSATLSQLR